MEKFMVLTIVGLGAVSQIGSTVPEYWRRICGEDPTPQELDANVVSAERIEHRKFFYSDISRASWTNNEGQSSVLLLAKEAISEAIADAGLNTQKQKIALVIGTGAGEIDHYERSAFENTDEKIVCTYTLSAKLAKELNLTGPNLTIGLACAASAYSFLLAQDIMDSDDIDAVIVCGVEPISRTTQATMHCLMALDPQSCRPFSDDRGGTMLGDGAAAIVLRQKTTLNSYAHICGIGVNSDAYHPTAPKPGGEFAAKAMGLALDCADIKPEDIDVIIPHGTGTLINDLEEYKALQLVLGERLPNIPLFPLKGKIGHTAGAAGAFAILTLALILKLQQMPPMFSIKPSEQLKVDIPRDYTRELDAQFGITNAYAFGGNNISIVLGCIS